MKKFMSLLLVGIMMLSLVACGKSGGGRGELNVGVFYYTYSDTYISSVRTHWIMRLPKQASSSRIMTATVTRPPRTSRSIPLLHRVPTF